MSATSRSSLFAVLSELREGCLKPTKPESSSRTGLFPWGVLLKEALCQEAQTTVFLLEPMRAFSHAKNYLEKNPPASFRSPEGRVWCRPEASVTQGQVGFMPHNRNSKVQELLQAGNKNISIVTRQKSILRK